MLHRAACPTVIVNTEDHFPVQTLGTSTRSETSLILEFKLTFATLPVVLAIKIDNSARAATLRDILDGCLPAKHNEHE